MTLTVLAERFVERWTLLGGQVFYADDPADLPAALVEAAQALVGGAEEAPPTVVAWETGDDAFRGWSTALSEPEWAYHGFSHGAEGVSSNGRPLSRDEARDLTARASLGITGCAWAVADTGTVAVVGGAAGGLWPTLLPPAHLSVVRTGQIVGTVGDGLRALADQARSRGRFPPMVKLISGPSSTADIEGQLWVGVHGPARVGVVLVAG